MKKTKMKAIGYYASGPISRENALVDLDVPTPEVLARDVLVRVAAISVNPVDTKVRIGVTPESGQAKILGWDAVGVVEAVGSDVRHFRLGDRVWYAGSITRQGANAQLHAVDERLISRAPVNLSDADAAALPLTAITAWEMLFDRLGVSQRGGQNKSLLIIGGAGGVGSILIQLARQLTQLRVIATASREQSRQWCLDMGAHEVIDHNQAMSSQLQALGVPHVDMIASLTQTDKHFDTLIEMLKPQGQLALIDDPAEPLSMNKLKRKSISLHWELMFTRSIYSTEDMSEQGHLLSNVAKLVEQGIVRTTATQKLSPISVAHLKNAHELQESGRAIGKTVLSSWT
jgi:zinc-binding alcohol dehydrogenase family protein